MTVQQVVEPQRIWHDRPAEFALAELNATRGRLSENEVQTRLKTCGPNRLPDPPKRSALTRFLLHFHNILIYVLLGSAVITINFSRGRE